MSITRKISRFLEESSDPVEFVLDDDMLFGVDLLVEFAQAVGIPEDQVENVFQVLKSGNKEWEAKFRSNPYYGVFLYHDISEDPREFIPLMRTVAKICRNKDVNTVVVMDLGDYAGPTGDGEFEIHFFGGRDKDDAIRKFVAPFKLETRKQSELAE